MQKAGVILQIVVCMRIVSKNLKTLYILKETRKR